MTRNELLKKILDYREDYFNLFKTRLIELHSGISLSRLNEDQLIKLKELCNDLSAEIVRKLRETRPQQEASCVKIQTRN